MFVSVGGGGGGGGEQEGSGRSWWFNIAFTKLSVISQWCLVSYFFLFVFKRFIEAFVCTAATFGVTRMLIKHVWMQNRKIIIL